MQELCSWKIWVGLTVPTYACLITAHGRQEDLEACLNYKGRPHLKITGLEVVEYLLSIGKVLYQDKQTEINTPNDRNKAKNNLLESYFFLFVL